MRKVSCKNMATVPSLEEIGPMVLPRYTWGGKEELKCKAKIHHPVRFIFHKMIDRTPTSKYIETCAEKLLWLQKRQREKGRRSDLRYNFVIGSDGYVYEGRGWDFRPDLEGRGWTDFPDILAEHIFGEPLPSKSIFIGYMEGFKDESKMDLMVKARDALVKYGVENKYISRYYSTYQLGPAEQKRIRRRIILTKRRFEI